MQNTPAAQPRITPEAFPIHKAIPGLLITFLIPIVCIIVGSGQYNWWEAWVMIILTGLTTIIGRLLLIIKHPDLAMERVNYKEKSDAQSWDKILMPLVAIYGPLLIWIVAGLDKRFQASPALPWQVEILAMLLMVLAYGFSSWAMLANRFFAAVVRIQQDRGQQVVDTGPYRFVRHPGYAGALLGFLLFPLALSVYWAYLPGLVYLAAVLLRTAKEDQLLQNELAGYAQYSTKTRYRLFPGIW
jgi:protein-S-isoprenylcysteine O-methyltransferase Ste14